MIKILKISREIKTAILVIGAIALFLFGFSFLKGQDLFNTDNIYYTDFDYNALNQDAPVTLKGNRIGKVEEITYDFETGKTRVSFSVDSRFIFSKNSSVRMYELGLMGGNAITIIPANDKEYAKNNDFFKSEVEEGLVKSLTSNFSGLSTGLDLTLKKADTLITGLNLLVNDNSNRGLKNAIFELNKTLSSYGNLSVTLENLIKEDNSKLNTTLSQFSSTAKSLKGLTDSLQNANLGKTVANLDSTLSKLNVIFSGVEEGKGTIGKLMKDDQLYYNFESATKELEELLQDIKLHPKRYFRILSKKEIPYEKPMVLSNNK
jgi:phospholipid/cholesterol/gamma-HCH transport system substrate-binding protein